MRGPTIQELAGQIKVLEERMNTRQAEYESAIDRLRADMATRDRDAAQRDRDTMRWFIGIGIAIIALLIGNLIAPIFGG